MARIRSIKPEFWTSAQVMECSPMARLLFIGMWNFADDAGRMAYSPKTLKAQIYPSDDISSTDVARLVDELSLNDLILIYGIDGKEFISISGWHHQKIDKPKPSKIPGPLSDASSTIRRKVAPDLSGSEGIVSDQIVNSDAPASGAEAPIDHRKRLFDEGLPKLAAMTGKGPDACRSFVGKCLKAAGDDAVTVLGLIEDAERNQAVDPSAWIAARLKQPVEIGGNGRRTVHDAARDLSRHLQALNEPAPGLCEPTGGSPVRLLSARRCE